MVPAESTAERGVDAATMQCFRGANRESFMSDVTTKEVPGATARRRPGEPAGRREGEPAGEPQLQWDDQKMATSFANVVNIQSTREQVDLFFGTNQTWNAGDDAALTVELSNRIILSPFAAKRLTVALNSVLREYESRYGQLSVEG
jgi:hypothetical protein